MDEIKIVECGCPGHFILADRCCFRRHTQVGQHYRVSTVGELEEAGGTIGYVNPAARARYETMVFRTEASPQDETCGCYIVESWSAELSMMAGTASQAQRVHDAAVKQFAARLQNGG